MIPRILIRLSALSLVLLALGVASGAQTKTETANPAPPKTAVFVSQTDDGLTSELPFIPIGRPTNARDAQFSAKYFGPQSDSDISFLILARFPQPRYGEKRTFAIKIIIDGQPLNGTLRMVNRVARDEVGESLQFSVSTEEVAWMATADDLQFTVLDGDSNEAFDTYRFTVAGLNEFKSFARSVRLMRQLLTAY